MCSLDPLHFLMATLPITCSDRCSKILADIKLKPKAVYEDLHMPGVKQQVQGVVRDYAGVYVIINLVNGKTYVGSAITGRMSNRFHKHLYGLSGSTLVAAAVRLYGLENFAFTVADTISVVVTSEDNKALLTMEDSYIQALQPEYNIAQVAGNTFGVKHTSATKLAMSLNYSSERREAIGALNRGKSLSTITIEKIRSAAFARGPLSAESRALVSENSAKAYF
jgi:group I intron endonuclease